MPKPRLIFLIGYRGSGKTTVARALAERLGWSWRDADAVLEERFGRTIREIFAEEGEAGFRDKEAEVLLDLAGSIDAVIATGGGVILRPDNRELLRKGFAVWLRAEPEVLFRRIQQDVTTVERRPALAQGGLEEVRQLLEKREPLYSQCANLVIDAGQADADDVVGRILKSM